MDIDINTYPALQVRFMRGAQAIGQNSGGYLVLAELENQGGQDIGNITAFVVAKNEFLELLAIKEIRVASMHPGQVRPMKVQIPAQSDEVQFIQLHVAHAPSF